MTGFQFKRLRHAIGVDPFAFAGVLGVHVSTIYRWETSKRKRLVMDPLHDQIVNAIYQRLTAGHAEPASFKRAIVNGLTEGGTLVALKSVLELLVI